MPGEQTRPALQSESSSHDPPDPHGQLELHTPGAHPAPHVLFTHVRPSAQSIDNEQSPPSGTRPAPGNLMVHTAFGEKTTIPSVLGLPAPLPAQEPVHSAWLDATKSMVVSGAADAEHVGVLPGPQLNGPPVTLPWPRMFRRSVT